MNAILNALRPLAQFLQDIHRPARNTAPQAHEPSLMQLYRLTRGRESIAPGVGAILANRFDR